MAKRWVIAACFSCVLACAQVPAAGEKTAEFQVPLTIVFSGNQCICNQTEFQAKRFESQKEIDAFLKQDSKRTLGVSKRKTPSLDFSKNIIVAIWMGKKPTAGYQLTLAQDKATIKNHEAIIRVNLKTPASGSMSAQVITSPCLLVTLPKGDYNTLKIVSQKNDQLADLPISK